MRRALIVTAISLLVGAILGSVFTSRLLRVDRAAEVKAIREASQRWLAAEVAKDIPTIASFYAKDAIEMPDNTPPIHGRKAIQKWYETWLRPEGVGMTFATDTVLVSRSGDYAFELGTYRFAQASPRGITEDVGKYATVWKKEGGKWRVAVDIANSNLPLAPAP